MTKKVDEIINNSEIAPSIRESLDYYKDHNKMVHLVLKNRRFYNGEINEIKNSIVVFEDKKIGTVLLPLKEIYLAESFREPAIKDSLDYYKDEKAMVHITLKNHKHYNGTINDIRDSMIILNDQKIGLVAIQLKDVYLAESYYELKERNFESEGILPEELEELGIKKRREK